MPKRDVFSEQLTSILGPQHDEDYSGPDAPEWGVLPPHVYRVMSDDEYQSGIQRGFFQSDERNNWRAQQRSRGNPKWDEVPQEGTVAGLHAYLGYLPRDRPGRVVKFDTSVGGWEIHPHVAEGDYARTLGPIPASSVRAVTPPIVVRNGGAQWQNMK